MNSSLVSAVVFLTALIAVVFWDMIADDVPLPPPAIPKPGSFPAPGL